MNFAVEQNNNFIIVIPNQNEINMGNSIGYRLIGVKKIRKLTPNPTRYVCVFEGPRGGIFRLYPGGSRDYTVENFMQIN